MNSNVVQFSAETGRRNFIKGLLASTGVGFLNLPLLSIAGADHQIPATPELNYSLVAVHDVRLLSSSDFSHCFECSAIKNYAINQDLTGAWLNVLEPTIKKAPTIVFGLTSQLTMFGLAQLMSSHRMTVSFQMLPDQFENERYLPTEYTKLVSQIARANGKSINHILKASEINQIGTDSYVAWIARPTIKDVPNAA